MTLPTDFKPDPDLDLVLEREVDVPPDRVWAAWTQPEQLKRWFAPAPFTTTDCEIDLRPGGIFRTVMRSPEGEEFAGDGCFLEVVESRRLVWTSALGPGFRPNVVEDIAFTAIIPANHLLGHPLHRRRHAQRCSVSGGRRNGLPGGVGRGARPARRPGQGAEIPSRASSVNSASRHLLGPRLIVWVSRPRAVAGVCRQCAWTVLR